QIGRLYDLFGQVIKTKDAAGNFVTNTYNNQGLLITVSNSFGQAMAMSYNINDRVMTNVNSAGVTNSQTYDDERRLLTRSHPDGGVERFAYSTNFHTITGVTNQLTNIVVYAYDSAERKTNEIQKNLVAAICTN